MYVKWKFSNIKINKVRLIFFTYGSAWAQCLMGYIANLAMIACIITTNYYFSQCIEGYIEWTTWWIKWMCYNSWIPDYYDS